MWVYDITSGNLYRPAGTVAGVGYAGGNLGRVPAAVNNPSYCDQHDIGPLPPGDYIMLWGVIHPRLGPGAIQLVPKPSNVMYNRGGFFEHGDDIANLGKEMASDGCIVMNPATRAEVDASDDRLLRVVVNYAP